MRPSSRGDERSLAFLLPSGTLLRFVVLLVCVITTTTRTADSYVLAKLTRGWGEGGPGCFQVWSRYVRAIRDVDGAAIGALVDEHRECFFAPNPLPLPTPLSVLLVLVVLVLCQYFLAPALRTRRRRLVRLRLDDVPDLRRTLRECCALAGVRVTFLLDVLNPRVGGVAFGLPGRRYVALNRGLLVLAGRDPEAFRAIVLHELAHVRNRDIDLTALTLAVWRSFVFGVLVPVGVLLVFDDDFAGSYNPWLTGWQLLLTAGIALLVRNSVLRSREYYADLRSVHWAGSPAGLLGVLDRKDHDRWAHRLLRLHPSPAERRDAVNGWHPLLKSTAAEFLLLGMVAGLGWPTVLQQLALPELLAEEVRYTGWQLAALTVPVGLVLSLAVWRSVLFARMSRGRSRATALGTAFAAGLVLGVALTPVDSALGLFPLAVEWELELLWCFAVVGGCWLTTGWIALTAAAWARVTWAPPAPVVAVLGASVGAALLTSWLAPLLRARLPLQTAETPALPMVHRALVDLGAQLDPATAVGRYLLAASVVVVGFPLLGSVTGVGLRVADRKR
ncbi:M48 family metalloprotease [Saccharopolyspora erythraea]|uniref:M48 family metallopeptidase n=1 Tax=Saccharopolyspora erythraea TaxID=1836 RepID=UPI001BA692E1|nr:M48 family metalloprotease [Saccharopolyspora erythraea]QUH00325.1 M48 family metalloprotease [Saccharopolyspora erythraea]